MRGVTVKDILCTIFSLRTIEAMTTIDVEICPSGPQNWRQKPVKAKQTWLTILGISFLLREVPEYTGETHPDSWQSQFAAGKCPDWWFYDA